MRLEGISAEIRPRNSWEAVDLGWVLARQHYGATLRAWSITVVPMWLLILLAMHSHPLWAMGVIWWLKPVAERVPLFVLSRALFGERVTGKELLRQWPRMIGRRIWNTLFWRRLSPVRTLVAPLIDLEEVQGMRLSRQALRNRRHSITLGAGTAAFWMQSLALLVLHTSWSGLLFFAYLMIPERHRPDLRVLFDEWGEPGAWGPLAGTWCGIGLYLVCLSLVTPFFVGGGFGLYLNSRTQQEGWDVELAFRRMSNRLTKAGAALALAFALAFLSAWPSPASGAEPPTHPPGPQQTIAEILQDPDFEIHKTVVYRLKNREEKKADFDLPKIHLPFLSGAGPALTWCILVPLALFVVYLLVRAIATGRDHAGRAGPRRSPVKTVMGLNVEEEKLPPALVEAARQLWNRGDREGATRLLYRGALSWLVHRAGVAIQESDTEVDCLRRVRAQQRPEIAYFSDLTRTWIRAAYGKRYGTEEEMSALFASWPFASPAKGGNA